MLKKLIIVFALGFGLSFLAVHIANISYFIAPAKLNVTYVTFWRIFLAFLIFSVVYPAVFSVKALFGRPTSVLITFMPLCINITVLVLVCVVSLLHG